MPWDNSPEKRKRDAQVYDTPEYRRNRAVALRRADGRCEMLVVGVRCGSRNRVQCDHIIPKTQGGTNKLDNLRVLCHGHHQAKTMTEGGGWRRRKGASDPRPKPRTQW